MKIENALRLANLEALLAAVATIAVFLAVAFMPVYCPMEAPAGAGAAECAKLCRPNEMRSFDSTNGIECVCADAKPREPHGTQQK